VAFSSRGFEAKVVGSRKLRVEIAREEKKGCDGREAKESRDEACRVSNRGSRSARSAVMWISLTLDLPTASIPLAPRHPVLPDQASICVLLEIAHADTVGERRSAAHVYGIQNASKGIEIVRRAEL
jgi:hypothetical protein